MQSATTARNPRFQLDQTADVDLIARLADLVAAERVTLADVLCHIAEVDARRLYLHYGCPSMYVYATEILGLSEAAAYHRIHAARVARDHPEIFDDVAAGRLHLAGVCLLAPHLDAVGGDHLLAEARGKSTKEIRKMVASARPEPRVPDSVTPVGEDRVVVRFTAGAGIEAKLEEARALLGHSVPDGNLGEVFERALDALIEKTRKRRYAATDQPRPARPSGKRTRHVPAEVRRAVAERDEERCTYVGVNGRRCGARGFVELHHEEPYARGGEHSTDQIRIVCQGHNALLAEEDFGQEHMARVSGRQLASRRVDEPGQLASKRVESPPPTVPAELDAERELREMRQQVLGGLVRLGYRRSEAQRAVAAVAAPPGIAIEDFLRAALRKLGPSRSVESS